MVLLILTKLIEGFILVNNYILSLLPTFPQTPSDITSPINTILGIIFNHIELLDLFIPLQLVLILIPIVIVISNLNYLWAVIDWIWCHIPLFGASK